MWPTVLRARIRPCPRGQTRLTVAVASGNRRPSISSSSPSGRSAPPAYGVAETRRRCRQAASSTSTLAMEQDRQALADLLDRLSLDHRVCRRSPTSRGSRPDLGCGAPLVDAVVQLEQIVVELDATCRRNDLGGLRRPSTAGSRRHAGGATLQRASSVTCLVAASVVERDVGAAGVAAGNRPFGLTMTHHQQLRPGHVKRRPAVAAGSNGRAARAPSSRSSAPSRNAGWILEVTLVLRRLVDLQHEILDVLRSGSVRGSLRAKCTVRTARFGTGWGTGSSLRYVRWGAIR